MNIKVLGIDLAKNVFEIHGMDERGKTVLRKTLSRNKVAEFVQKLPVCLIGMEACSSAHYWARKFLDLPHFSGHKILVERTAAQKPLG